MIDSRGILSLNYHFELEVFFVLRFAFAVRTLAEFYERSISFDFLLPLMPFVQASLGPGYRSIP